MIIRLLHDLPIERRHGATEGRDFEVLQEKREDSQFGVKGEGRLVGWYVMGDAGERVLVLRGEAEELD